MKNINNFSRIRSLKSGYGFYLFLYSQEVIKGIEIDAGNNFGGEKIVSLKVWLDFVVYHSKFRQKVTLSSSNNLCKIGIVKL